MQLSFTFTNGRYTPEERTALLEEIFRKYHKQILSFVQTKDRYLCLDQAEDVVMDTFLKMADRIEHIEPAPGVFFSYWRVACQNNIIDRKRRPGNNLLSLDAFMSATSEDGQEREFDIPDNSINFVDALESKHNRAALQETVHRVVQSLPVHHRTVIKQHYMDELEVKEIGHRNCIPEGTVKSKLARARESMRPKLESHLAELQAA